jgi:hypothetical protein
VVLAYLEAWRAGSRVSWADEELEAAGALDDGVVEALPRAPLR